MITFWEGLSLPWFPIFAAVFVILGLLTIGGMMQWSRHRNGELRLKLSMLGSRLET